VLRGPSNNFEARVCDLRGVRASGAGGIEARFLRFVPIVEGDVSARGLRVKNDLGLGARVLASSGGHAA
jgi:hypothetical protein